MTGKRRFGRVRRLPSGRWQSRYKGPDGIDRPAGRTFDSKADAERWLAKLHEPATRELRRPRSLAVWRHACPAPM